MKNLYKSHKRVFFNAVLKSDHDLNVNILSPQPNSQELIINFNLLSLSPLTNLVARVSVSSNSKTCIDNLLMQVLCLV